MPAFKNLLQTDLIYKFIKKFNAPGLKEKTNFFRLFAISQKAGLWLRDALIAIRRSEHNKAMIEIIDNLAEDLTNGSTFSQAMSNHDYFFKEDEIALAQSAETMGNLPEICDEIAVEGESFEKITQKIKKAAMYPAILLCFSVVAVVILLLFVIPTIVTLFPSQESLPGITKFMIQASAFLRQTRWLILMIIAGSVVAYKVLYEKTVAFKMAIDKTMLILPVISDVVKTFYMYKFTRLLGQLLEAGVSPILALKLIGNSFSNFFYKKKMFEIRNNLKTGFGFSESMEWSSLFDPILIQIIHIGEDTGNMREVLKKMSEFYRDQLQSKIDILMAFLEPILMALIATIIGTMVAGIFLPMADLVNVIQ